MMINKYILAAVMIASAVCCSYVLNFYFKLGYVVSSDPGVWGQLGDYIGGLLNPVFSFMSFVLIIKSLTLQNDANVELRNEIKNTRKTEKLRSFETQLFHMIGSQRSSFESFKVDEIKDGVVVTSCGVEAVIVIEKELERLRSIPSSDEVIVEYLEKVDPTDQIFGLTRIFYNIVKMITEKLSDSNGFELDDRKSHYMTLINFTDFALLRLIMMSAQFMDYSSTEYLKGNLEFNATLDEVGLNYELY